MKFRAALAALAIVLGVAGPALGTPALAASPAAGSVTISVAPGNSAALAPGDDLAVVVTIDNSTQSDLDAGSATVATDTTAFASRSSLYDWMNGKTSESVTASSLNSADTPAIAAGSSQVVTVTVPTGSLPYGAPGVYPIDVTVTGGDSAVGSARTAIAWNSAATTPVSVAVAAPLTVPTTGADTAFLDAKVLATDTAPTGILTRELDDLENSQVAIGIDPRILASIRVLGKSAPQSAQDWLARLEAVQNETFPLAWADADLTAALQAGESSVPAVEPLDYAVNPSLFGPSTTQPSSSPATTPPPTSNPSLPALPSSSDLTAFDYTLPKLSWPAPNSVVGADLPKLAKSGINEAILSSANLSKSVARTPTGAAANVGDLKVAVSDSVLSDYLSAAVKSHAHADWTADVAKLTTAVDEIGLASSGSAPVTLATLDRNWFTDARQLSHTLNALYSQPWAHSTPLSTAMSSTSRAAKIVNRPESVFRVSRVRAMLDAETQEVGFSVVAESPQALTSSRRLVLLSLLSNEWPPNGEAWNTASQKFLTDSAGIVNSVQVVDSSPVLFLTDRGALPITVNNEFNQPVTVYISVRPQATQLSVAPKYSRVKVTIDADAQRKTEIPVSSLSNGKVQVSVTLYSVSGGQIGTAKSVSVNVQAGWETAGTVVFAVLVFALFGFGIFRNVRKRRKARTGE